MRRDHGSVRPRFRPGEWAVLTILAALLAIWLVWSWIEATRGSGWDALVSGVGVLFAGTGLLGLMVTALIARFLLDGAVGRLVAILIGPIVGMLVLLVVARVLT